MVTPPVHAITPAKGAATSCVRGKPDNLEDQHYTKKHGSIAAAADSRSAHYGRRSPYSHAALAFPFLNVHVSISSTESTRCVQVAQTIVIYTRKRTSQNQYQAGNQLLLARKHMFREIRNCFCHSLASSGAFTTVTCPGLDSAPHEHDAHCFTQASPELLSPSSSTQHPTNTSTSARTNRFHLVQPPT